MTHRAEHFSSPEAAEKKPRGHRPETHRRPERSHEGKSSEAHHRHKMVEEEVSADEQESLRLRQEINIKAKNEQEEAARLKAQESSQDFYETFGMYPSQLGSEEEAAKLWSKDTGFFRRIAAKLSGAENAAASQAWKAWYAADQEVEILKTGAPKNKMARDNESASLAKNLKEMEEPLGSGLVEEVSKLSVPGLASDLGSSVREGRKAIAATKKIEAEMAAESHRSKAARAAESMLNRIGLIAQEQAGYEDLNLPAEKLQAMNIMDLESALHGFDAKHGKEGLKSLETSSEPRSYDSKETQQASKETVKTIKALRGTYDKQMDKFQEEYKAYLETPAGMQEATALALGRLENLRNESLGLSSPEETKAFGDRLSDLQRQMTDMEESLNVVREKIKKEAGEKGASSKTYRESPQAKLFITLQEGVKDLYEDQQKRVRDGSKQNMKSRVGMYGTKTDVPQVGAMGGFGDIAPRVGLGGRSSRGKKEAPPAEVIEDMTTHAVLEDETFKALEDLDKKPAPTEAPIELKRRKGPKINAETDEAWAALEQPQSQMEAAYGKDNTEEAKASVQVILQNFEARAEGSDDEGKKAELKELKKLLNNAKDGAAEYLRLIMKAHAEDEKAQKKLDRINALVSIDADSIEDLLQSRKPEEQKKKRKRAA